MRFLLRLALTALVGSVAVTAIGLVVAIRQYRIELRESYSAAEKGAEGR